jgi:hypothetical protein
MFAWQPGPALVLCPPVTVIAGVRLIQQQVLLVADRAVINPTWEVTAGTPATLPDRDKLFTTPAGAAVALAGISGGAGVPDLRAASADIAASAGTARRITYELIELFSRAASAVRAAPAAAGAATVVEPFEVPVITVALVAGPDPNGVLLQAVGLTASGPCVDATLTGHGVAYGPQEERARLNVAVSRAADMTVADASRHLREAIAETSLRHRALVSIDCDTVVVGPAGAGPIEPYRHPGVVLPRGI